MSSQLVVEGKARGVVSLCTMEPQCTNRVRKYILAEIVLSIFDTGDGKDTLSRNAWGHVFMCQPSCL